MSESFSAEHPVAKKFEVKEDGPTYVALRKANMEDLPFLFKVSTEAMRPIVEELNPERVFDEKVEFEKYKEKFNPEEIDIIQYEGQDVGRLRVVRSSESIYIGGIQILPEFQRLGIGETINRSLMEESDRLHIPIIGEVHHVNKANLNLKRKLGFEEISRNENQVVMRYLKEDK